MTVASAEVTRTVAAVRRRLPEEVAASGPTISDDDERVIAARLAADEFPALNQARVRAGIDRLAPADMDQLVALTLAHVFGLGGLQVHIDDPDVENIDVNGHDNVWVTYADGRCVRVAPVAASDDDLIEVVKHAARRLGLGESRWDTTAPLLDLHLPDGSRLHAVLGGKSQRGVAPVPGVSIRRHRFDDMTLRDLVRLGSISAQCAAFLSAAVRARRTILVAGGTNTGKTTMLRALCHEIPAHERLITVEKDLLELQLHASLRHPNVMPLHSRQANVEGAGAVEVAELVRTTLRMNPSRVIVGEVLGDEVLPMLNAMSQGNDGSMGTIHAESASQSFSRLATYAVQSSTPLPPAATYQLVADSIHFVVFLDAEWQPGEPMTRRVVSVREVTGLSDSGHVASSEVYRYVTGSGLVPAAPLTPRHSDLLERFGYGPADHAAVWAA